MAGYRRLDLDLFDRHRRHPERLIALLELDRDVTLRSHRVRPARAYARIWGVSRTVATRLLGQYRPLMGDHLRIGADLLWKHRNRPDRVLQLLELDADARRGGLLPVREYARLWDLSRGTARRLIGAYQASRTEWEALDQAARDERDQATETGPQADQQRTIQPPKSKGKSAGPKPDPSQSGATTLEGRGGTPTGAIPESLPERESARPDPDVIRQQTAHALARIEAAQRRLLTVRPRNSVTASVTSDKLR